METNFNVYNTILENFFHVSYNTLVFWKTFSIFLQIAICYGKLGEKIFETILCKGKLVSKLFGNLENLRHTLCS